MKQEYKNLYGTWVVTTEGDVEVRSVKHLGTHTGYVDEIALHLADKAYYSLEFKKIEPIKQYFPSPNGESVNVRFDIESETWNTVHTPDGLAEIQDVFENRPVQILRGQYFATFQIKTNSPIETEKDKILKKLTLEERKILGF